MDEKKAEKLHRFLPTHLSQTSLPQTVVPPTVVTAELAALGHVRGGGPPAQAAFAATGAAVSFLVASANFLVNGVSAQVGAAAANGHWLSLRGRVRAALLVSVAVGLVWGLALAGLRGLVIDQVLSLRRDAAAAAEPFFVLRAAALPFVLLNSAVAGTLQGYGRVGASAAIAGLAAALEALGVAALLLRQENAAGGARLSHFVPPLVLVGRASLTATALASAAGLLLVQCSAPEKSRDPLGLSSFFYLRAPATTVVPDEDTHGGVDLDVALVSSSGAGAEGGAEAGGNEGEEEEEEEPRLSMRTILKELVSGSLYLFGRSICLQTTFLTVRFFTFEQVADGERGRERGTEVKKNSSLKRKRKKKKKNFLKKQGVAVASRRGTAALSAHAILSQSWMFTSTVCDGVETAACVLGSRLAAVAKSGSGSRQGGGGDEEGDEGRREATSRAAASSSSSSNATLQQRAARAKQAFLLLSKRLLLSGVAIGTTYSLLMTLFREQIARVFTRDEGAIAFLLSGPAWPVVVAAQPLNSLVFISDGLIYAVRDFRGAFLSMFVSFALGFLPALALFAGVVDRAGVFPIWLAKAFHNVGRLAGVSWFVWVGHYRRW